MERFLGHYKDMPNQKLFKKDRNPKPDGKDKAAADKKDKQKAYGKA
ncbi:hypothetical protein KY358_04455 [Candidatus Woesearchaeota archaeon]|nr:hypothetical protein [Candidatus Woesearchaeota archaeon]